MKKCLPDGWKWNYIIPPIEKFKKPFWSADAIKYLNKEKFVKDIGSCGLFNEVYAIGRTKKDAVEKVIKIIRFKKRFPRRYIYLSFFRGR